MTHNSSTRRSFAYIAKMPGAVQGGSSLNQIFAFACNLADQSGLAHSEVRQLLFERWVHPLDARAVKRVLSDVFKRNTGSPHDAGGLK
jgi:hypothetical protein